MCLPRLAEILHRTEARRCIEYICLRIELSRYECRACEKEEKEAWCYTNTTTINSAVWQLFSILGTWRAEDTTPKGVVVEIDAFSPSDAKHSFKNLIFGDDEHDLGLTTTSQCPGWTNGRQTSAPGFGSINRLFKSFRPDGQIDALMPNQVVTQFVIRRQTRRRLTPTFLAKLVGKCERLEHIRYENWRQWTKFEQGNSDLGKSYPTPMAVPTSKCF
ncbi:putative F-box domain-containing protein [Seiridium cardinale]